MGKTGQEYTAVFTYELGDDLGFGSPLLCIADELGKLAGQRGCQLQTVFAVSDPVYCGHEAAFRGHRVVSAPVNKQPLEIYSRGKSYANILAVNGFAHERELKLRAEAWDRLFTVLSPDVIVAESSPTACLAARGRIPLMAAGSGFDVPPAGLAIFPAIAGDCEPETNQALLRDTVNKVLKSRGIPVVDYLPELFAAGRRAVFTVPQFDPYHAHRKETLLGPCIGIEGPFAPREAPSIFFSLPSTLPCLSGVVRALEQVNAAISCYVPGPETAGLAMLQQIGAHIYETRPDLEHVLQEAEAVLAASADLAMAAYLAGRPQVIIRRDLETSVMASELEKRGTAIALDLADVDSGVKRALKDVLNNSSYARSAREEARRARPFIDPDRCAAIAAQQCSELFMR